MTVWRPYRKLERKPISEGGMTYIEALSMYGGEPSWILKAMVENHEDCSSLNSPKENRSLLAAKLVLKLRRMDNDPCK